MPVTVQDVLDTLLSLHERGGQLLEIRDTCLRLHRAATFNPRGSDDWDIFDLRNDYLRRTIAILRQRRTDFRRMQGASTDAPNHSDELSRLFFAWADTRARSGAGSRPDLLAGLEFYNRISQWSAELRSLQQQSQRLAERMPRIQAFYTAEAQMFRELQQICENIVRYWPSTAHQAQALAFMLDFETCFHLTQDIAGTMTQIMRRVGSWTSNIQAAEAECTAWGRWGANRASVERDVTRRTEPRP